MWTIRLYGVFIAYYLYAIGVFFHGFRRNGYPAWWILPILICPPSIAVLCARARLGRLRAAHAPDEAIRAAGIRLKVSVWFLAACIAAVLVPGIVIYYLVMDGASSDLLPAVPVWETLCLVGVTVIYLLYLRSGRSVSESR